MNAGSRSDHDSPPGRPLDGEIRTDSPPNRSVAIIALHGVGQHPCGASAGALSTLLMSLRSKLAVPYPGFLMKSLRVPVRPVVSTEEQKEQANERSGLFDERRGFLYGTRKDPNYAPRGYKPRELRRSEPDRGDYGYQFMLTQLAGYQGEPDRYFETVRLESNRLGNGPTVHIYDAHYSDLTKPQTTIGGFFFAFYQLLIHLASLSLLAVYWAEAENVRSENVKADGHGIGRWRLASTIHAVAVRLLVMVVPILNLILLLIASTAFIDKIRSEAGALSFALLLAGGLGLATTFYLIWRAKTPSPSRPVLWSAVPFLGTGGITLILWELAHLYTLAHPGGISSAKILLLFVWLLSGGLVLGWIGYQFDALRPGAFVISMVFYAGNVGLFLFYLLPVNDHRLARASLWAVQWVYGQLSLSWVLCLFFALLSLPVSLVCVRGIKAAARRDRAVAAFRTGRFAFAVPALLFVIVTCTLWSGVLVWGSDKLKAFDQVSACQADDWPASRGTLAFLIPKISTVEDWVREVRSDPENQVDFSAACLKPETFHWSSYWSDYLKGLLLVSVTPGLPVMMVLFAMSLLLLTWAVLPSILFEVQPSAVMGATSKAIRSLGWWLTRGLDNTAILTRLLWTAIVPVPFFLYFVDWVKIHPPQGQVFWPHGTFLSATRLTWSLITVNGFLAALSGAVIFGFILKYLTVVLDTVLDVDNYLRTSPLQRTPRALVAERCTSLLRYIAAYRDDHEQPYEKLIIVAHSLGSMVATDLLRYLERSGADAPDTALAPYGFRNPSTRGLPIYLFSMGSPLRQLVNRFFPHLYWWVSDIPENTQPDSPPGDGIHIPALRNPSLPRTDEMNVAYWANAYRSGDYVGRSLWIGPWFERNEADRPEQPPDTSAAGPRQCCEEMCIGLGAHTHYWDRTATDVAVFLDQLVRTTIVP